MELSNGGNLREFMKAKNQYIEPVVIKNII